MTSKWADVEFPSFDGEQKTNSLRRGDYVAETNVPVRRFSDPETVNPQRKACRRSRQRLVVIKWLTTCRSIARSWVRLHPPSTTSPLGKHSTAVAPILRCFVCCIIITKLKKKNYYCHNIIRHYAVGAMNLSMVHCPKIMATELQLRH